MLSRKLEFSTNKNPATVILPLERMEGRLKRPTNILPLSQRTVGAVETAAIWKIKKTREKCYNAKWVRASIWQRDCYCKREEMLNGFLSSPPYEAAPTEETCCLPADRHIL